MSTRARPPKTSRPAGGKQSKPKAKFWVLWEPPAQLLLLISVAILFASAGYIAVRYSSAQSADDGTQTTEVLLRDGTGEK